MTRFAGMIANQRSGTHLMRSAFNSHPELACPAEPLYRTYIQSAKHLREFLEQYSGMDARVVLDVKYDQITPPVETFFRTVPVIHLIRRDLERMFFSVQWRRYRFHVETAAQKERRSATGEMPTLVLSRHEFEQFARRVQAYREQYGELAGLDLVYEELTGNQEIRVFPEGAGREVCEFLGVAYHPMTVGFKKCSPSDIEPHVEWEE